MSLMNWKSLPQKMDHAAIHAIAGGLAVPAGENVVHYRDLAFHRLNYISGTDLGGFACQLLSPAGPLDALHQPCRFQVPEQLRHIVGRCILALGSLLARDRSAVAVLRKVDHRSKGISAACRYPNHGTLPHRLYHS
jgi:hypothetical protein